MTTGAIIVTNRKSYYQKLLLVSCLLFNAPGGQAAVMQRLDKGESLTIAAIGTSLTASSWSAWFGLTGEWLNSLYPGKVTLYNEAGGGAASKYLTTDPNDRTTPGYTLARYPASPSGVDVQLDKALAHNPDVVFIEFAMNDAPYDLYRISEQASKDNLQTMIDRINTWAAGNHKRVDIIVQTMNNCTDRGGATEATYRPHLAAYYQGYRDIAAANNILLIDHYPNWLNVYNSEADHATWNRYVDAIGIHPVLLGTQNVIMPEIKRVLSSQVPEPDAAIMTTVGLMSMLAYVWWRRVRGRSRPMAAKSILTATCLGICLLLQNTGLGYVRPSNPILARTALDIPEAMENTPVVFQGRRLLAQTGIARSRDLATWELSPTRSPMLDPLPGEGINATDADLFEVDGKTYISYATGYQTLTGGDIHQAMYDGTMQQLLEAYFPAGVPTMKFDAVAGQYDYSFTAPLSLPEPSAIVSLAMATIGILAVRVRSLNA